MKFDFLFYFFFSLFIVFFQSSPYFNQHLLVFEIKVNLIFILIVYAYTRYTTKISMLYAFSIGIICDLFSNSILGVYSVSFFLSTVPLLLFRNVFLMVTLPIFLIYVTCCSFLKAIILTIITSFIFDFYSGYKYFVKIGLLEIILNSLAAMPLFILFNIIFRLVDKLKVSSNPLTLRMKKF